MKRAIGVFCIFTVVFSCLCGNVPSVALADISTEITKTAAKSPTIPIEKDAETYVSQILTKPSVDDPRWVLLPKEEMADHLQLLVDSQNSNYERIRTWTGSYYQIQKYGSKDEQAGAGRSESVALEQTEDLFSFACDVVKNKSFMRFERLYERYSDKNGREIESPTRRIEGNICAVLTQEKFWQYNFGSNQIREELEGVMPGRVGKVCEVKSADKLPDVSRVGTFFDPRLFFYIDLDKQYERKCWKNLEKAYISWLRDEKNVEMHQRALKRISVWRGSFDDDIWYRVVYFTEDGNICDEYMFNSSSGFNMVSFYQCPEGRVLSRVTARFTDINGVKIPDEFIIEFANDRCFRYFKLIESKINEKIDDDQFTPKAMGVEDDCMILDHTKEKSFAYKNDRLVPVAKYGATKTAAQENSFWRSPARIAAFVLGLALILFVGARRLLRKAA